MMAPSQKDGAENPKPDWGKIFSEFACHTNIARRDLFRMSIPQIQAYRDNLGDNITLKIGMPGIFGGTLDNPAPSPTTGKPPKLSQLAAFCNSFNE